MRPESIVSAFSAIDKAGLLETEMRIVQDLRHLFEQQLRSYKLYLFKIDTSVLAQSTKHPQFLFILISHPLRSTSKNFNQDFQTFYNQNLICFSVYKVTVNVYEYDKWPP